MPKYKLARNHYRQAQQLSDFEVTNLSEIGVVNNSSINASTSSCNYDEPKICASRFYSHDISYESFDMDIDLNSDCSTGSSEVIEDPVERSNITGYITRAFPLLLAEWAVTLKKNAFRNLKLNELFNDVIDGIVQECHYQGGGIKHQKVD
ncbi:hypothetical protein RN001_000891 [Aquatica leii]|uniref:Uncharacterized protein n=1 Tax=Aquatica leii TaxID=1421715 RepID=A0AAN7PAQ0_9COLE|nr:hypothetical protein RN001_000891 [Aquatica leii]